MSLVIGEISYTNILPFFYHLDRDALKEKQCHFVPQVPSQLNEGMAAGRIDIGGISSFAYAANASAYTLLPNLSVTSYGKVNSIFLFSKVPMQEINGKNIALTSSSASSVHLLKIILQHFYSFENKYTTMEPDLLAMLQANDACMLIGDDAIRSKRELPDGMYAYDLGQLWYEQTGLPMTYAVFAVRNQAIAEQTELVGTVYHSFLKSKQLSESREYQPMVADIVKTHGGEKLFWDEYFNQLCNDFGAAEQKGLLYFYSLAYKMGFLPESITELNVWDSVSVQAKACQ
ncbi:menaquinone biosynthesis protein [Halalkalibacter nanhaiisediminis]|uniref:Chorismate dehydratase n=1 Tax=Halalkalibacter nanhaiisediminis TaxID=688079 RepID=A0A562QQA4_9BACI|nr:menaquinone biosynthesis protein [Halalkalibacter nanhaiisediminis]TWI58853.1 futalosine synthase [Halalkalibacter nanhaiisediminis]